MLTLLLLTSGLLGSVAPGRAGEPDLPACRVPSLADQLLARAHELQPAATDTLLRELAVSLAAEAQDALFDPWVGLAIAMQESSLRASAVGPTGDRSLYQFHPYTIRTMGLDAARLETDVAYAVSAFAKLLREKRTMCTGKRAWSCYHSTTPARRRQYEHDVGRYLRSKS